MPEVMNEAIEPKVTGRTMISSDVAPARLLAATAQVTGPLSVTVKDLSPAASVETCCPTSGLAGCTSNRTDGRSSSGP